MMNKKRRCGLWVTFIKMKIKLFGISTFCLIVFCASGCLKNNRPNVVLITIDALRPDHLGCYGYRRDTSPNLDKLAAGGVRFTDCISQAAVTVPSIPSIMTSLYPHEHRVVTLAQDNAIRQPTLAGILRSNGYATGLFIGHALERSGVSKGFGTAYFNIGADAKLLNSKAIEWLSLNKGKKYFLYLHYLDTHAPYHAPQVYRDLFLEDGLYRTGKHLPISTDARRPYTSDETIPFYAAQAGVDSVDYYVSLYDAGIRSTDEQVGLLLEAVKEHDRRYNTDTLVIISADHAEYLGEHHIYFAHGHNLFDAVIKVPLVISGPGIPQGKVIREQAGLIDIMPTVLDFLKVPCREKLSGVSLLGAIRGNSRHAGRIIASEIWVDDPKRSQLAVLSLRTGRGKLLYSVPDKYSQIIDFADNPGELKAPSAEDRDWSGQLRNELLRYIKDIPQYIEGSGFQPDEKTKGSLKSLGYLN
jgi:arylsulfatase A-like enzyme